MKQLIILTVLAIVLTGCRRTESTKTTNDPWTGHGSCIYTKVVEIEGHRYVLLDGPYSGGIIHAESCQCKLNK